MITISAVKEYFKNLQNQNYELIWAKTWDDTKKGIDWITDMPGISPGRWAVGYNYLYVMTRILNDKRPRSVLEFGLGISSTLISHYFNSQNMTDGIHDVVEQDEEWIDFYKKSNRITERCSIHLVDCVEKEYNGCRYNAYADINSVVKNKKYDVISIDGPIGTEKYSRRDILEFIPDILSDSFVIIIDDAQRNGERSTIADIKKILKKNQIDYREGVYPGMTDCVVITSVDNKFICSM